MLLAIRNPFFWGRNMLRDIFFLNNLLLIFGWRIIALLGILIVYLWFDIFRLILRWSFFFR